MIFCSKTFFYASELINLKCLVACVTEPPVSWNGSPLSWWQCGLCHRAASLLPWVSSQLVTLWSVPQSRLSPAMGLLSAGDTVVCVTEPPVSCHGSPLSWWHCGLCHRDASLLPWVSSQLVTMWSVSQRRLSPAMGLLSAGDNVVCVTEPPLSCHGSPLSWWHCGLCHRAACLLPWVSSQLVTMWSVSQSRLSPAMGLLSAGDTVVCVTEPPLLPWVSSQLVTLVCVTETPLSCHGSPLSWWHWSVSQRRLSPAMGLLSAGDNVVCVTEPPLSCHGSPLSWWHCGLCHRDASLLPWVSSQLVTLWSVAQSHLSCHGSPLSWWQCGLCHRAASLLPWVSSQLVTMWSVSQSHLSPAMGLLSAGDNVVCVTEPPLSCHGSPLSWWQCGLCHRAACLLPWVSSQLVTLWSVAHSHLSPAMGLLSAGDNVVCVTEPPLSCHGSPLSWWQCGLCHRAASLLPWVSSQLVTMWSVSQSRLSPAMGLLSAGDTVICVTKPPLSCHGSPLSWWHCGLCHRDASLLPWVGGWEPPSALLSSRCPSSPSSTSSAARTSETLPSTSSSSKVSRMTDTDECVWCHAWVNDVQVVR